jgi:hypothetical protein
VPGPQSFTRLRIAVQEAAVAGCTACGGEPVFRRAGPLSITTESDPGESVSLHEGIRPSAQAWATTIQRWEGVEEWSGGIARSRAVDRALEGERADCRVELDQLLDLGGLGRAGLQ